MSRPKEGPPAMRLRPILAALVALAAPPTTPHAQQPGYASWVGRRVVLENGSVLNEPTRAADGKRPGKAAAPRGRGALRVCRVGIVDGSWLWLRDEDGPAQGWADGSWVVPF